MVIGCKAMQDGWHQIALVGEWKGHSAGAFKLTKADLEQILQNFKRIGIDVVVDYEHQSLSGNEAPAAGWIRHPDGLKVDGEKLLAKIEWTPKAKEMIEKREYRYLSPTIIPSYADPISGEDIGWVLHSVALTNSPFLKELPPIANKQTQRKEQQMDQTKALKEENEKLKMELTELRKQLDEHKKVAAKARVKEAIAAKKLSKEQEAWALEYALKDPQGFESYLATVKPPKTPPKNDMFAAKDEPNDFDPISIV